MTITNSPTAGASPDGQPAGLARFDRAAPLADMLTAFETDGGFVVEGMVERPIIDALCAAATDYAKGVEPGSATQGMGDDGKEFVGTNTIRFSSLGQISPAYFELLDNEIFAAIADAVLLPNAGSYWVNTAQVMFIGPGEPAQVLHRDANNWWQHMQPLWPDGAEVTVSAMIGLEDVTEELGATRVVPGSQNWPELKARDRETTETVPAELAPGDAFVYSGKVLHGGGANQTDRWRRAMHLSFVVGWLTPEEASPLDYAMGELADKSERVQRLLGHKSYDSRPHPGGGLWLKHVKEM